MEKKKKGEEDDDGGEEEEEEVDEGKEGRSERDGRKARSYVT